MTTKYGPPQGTREELWVALVDTQLERDSLRRQLANNGSGSDAYEAGKLAEEVEQLRLELAGYRAYYAGDPAAPKWPTEAEV